MASSDFDPALFIHDGIQVPIDTTETPFFYNSHGHTYPLPKPKGTLIKVATDDPSMSLGRRHKVVSAKPKTIGTGDSAYQITEFDFGVDEVVYEPIWATKESAHAFGMTLLHHNESIRIDFDGLVSCDYIYGAFAGYQSPYIGSDRNRQLLTLNATDLEYHAFPHVFCSQDQLPLVTSVARYRSLKREIYLADLWVRPGDCLYVPPKQFRKQYVDLHGNRNSARACWGSEGKGSLITNTTLGNDAVFDAPATKPHYHEEKHPTVHSMPPGFSASSYSWI
jgi:hypothetical protein